MLAIRSKPPVRQRWCRRLFGEHQDVCYRFNVRHSEKSERQSGGHPAHVFEEKPLPPSGEISGFEIPDALIPLIDLLFN